MSQVAIMASGGRPRILRAMLDRLVAGGMPRRSPRIYFAGEPSELFLAQRISQGFEVVTIAPGRPFLKAFWAVIEDADESLGDLLFLECDVWLADDGLELMTMGKVPEGIGLVSFFDHRNDRPLVTRKELWDMPQGRPFWGSQAIRIPASVLPQLQELVRRREDLGFENAWDTWVGRAVESFGLSVTLHSPSLVQHLGEVSEVYPNEQRPTAKNFPGPWPRIRERRQPIYRNCNLCGGDLKSCPHVANTQENPT